MGFRDMLKKSGGDDEADDAAPRPAYSDIAVSSTPSARSAALDVPEFTLIRSDTYSQEVIYPPSGDTGAGADSDYDEHTYGGSNSAFLQTGGESSEATAASPRSNRRSFDVFRRSSRSSRSGSASSSVHGAREHRDKDKDPAVDSTARRLSHRLHLSRSPSTSSYVPADLPEIVLPEVSGDNGHGVSGDSSSSSGNRGRGSTPVNDPDVESQWERRAALLALENEKQQLHNSSSGSGGSRPTTPDQQRLSRADAAGSQSRSRSRSNSAVSSKELDANIQEAIRLHEDGQLEQSTRMFGILADPRGYNNPLSQVLYGLALRHGWGCAPDTEAAVNYLSAAASNAAAVEEMALQAGISKGGAAKGELVLAIFELANCFRHGWGLERDPVAAKQYYETAANLGDTDAMNEVAWCYLEGFGCKKDKFLSAKYYRLAEQNGNKTLGNSWIWKEKYDPEKQKKK